MSSLSFSELFGYLQTAFFETFLMCSVSLVISVILGLITGLAIFTTRDGTFWRNRTLNFVGGILVNVIRSIPFIILLVLLIPVTNMVVGSTIGPMSASISLSVASFAFFSRMVESSLSEVDRGVIEASKAFGASNWAIIRSVLLPEALPGIYRGITILAIGLVGNSANAGMVGGGGIGDLAIRFGYYRYQTDVMIVTVVLLIVLVQIIQMTGDWIAKKAEKR
ncbi:Methionine import system permease protein MetP [Bacteroidales bacterium Barb6]|nr:Methionine import system permease protein MetP [Bacteroidales bacterium Barb6]OAV71854.1 Methionine import system permease protein MetP [Bacteroidales bacterium Barb4]